MLPKPRIGLFGRCNTGKSTLFNLLVGQEQAVVSATRGTTTDPVRRAMELIGFGPVVMIDTPGIDDDSTFPLGQQRIDKALQELREVDLAILLFAGNDFDYPEQHLLDLCRGQHTPFVIVCSKINGAQPSQQLIGELGEKYGTNVLQATVCDASLRDKLTNAVCRALRRSLPEPNNLLDGIATAGDTLILVCPIDSEAPAGRLILPQVQVLRAALDLHARAIVCQPEELQSTIRNLSSPPRLVITDSQAFAAVASIVPDSVALTSFSIILARAKGPFDYYMRSAPAISRLQPSSRVLLIESCTHNSSCEDIGRVKLPRLLRLRAGADLYCETIVGSSHSSYPLADYDLIIQCGGCVATQRQVYAHVQPAIDAHIPVTNYGLALAYLTGIFHRATNLFS